jgi:hypothetical protein
VIGQNQIQRQLSQPENIARVRRLAAEHPDVLRTQLAERVCDEFDFVDRRARRQRGGCLKALRVLESRGLLTLPAPRTMPGPSRPRCAESGVAAPTGVPASVGQIAGLELVLVQTDDDLRIWNTLLQEHPRGSGRSLDATCAPHPWRDFKPRIDGSLIHHLTGR